MLTPRLPCGPRGGPAARRRGCDPGEPFLAGLEQEAERFAALAGGRAVHQVHLGGGSPTFLTSSRLGRLRAALSGRFALAPDAEIAVEVDPRVTRFEQLQALRGPGFNRVSLGVQDFAPAVQRAVNRLQPFELVEQVVGWCRKLGFPSINFDLIYGLPFPTLGTMAATLEQVVALAPDRIAFYRLAAIPEMFRWQNASRRADLPAGELSLDLNLLAVNRFAEAGYEFIGLDHFARPGEGLARARDGGTLHRNSQGMATGKELDLLGLGPSAASQFDDAFAQNTHTSAAWARAVRRDFATERGLRLSADDRVRREVLQQLYGYGSIAKRDIEARFNAAFDDYFADEGSRLRELSDQGLVALEADVIRLTAAGPPARPRRRRGLRPLPSPGRVPRGTVRAPRRSARAGRAASLRESLNGVPAHAARGTAPCGTIPRGLLLGAAATSPAGGGTAGAG
jgi:oxygen-independent coproporphyrinogen-3 oxidase